MMYACLLHFISARRVWLLYYCSNSEVHIVQMTSLMLFAPRRRMWVPHWCSTTCFKCHFTPSPSAFFHFIISMVSYVHGNYGHTRCAYTPVPHLGLTSASTWLVYPPSPPPPSPSLSANPRSAPSMQFLAQYAVTIKSPR